MVKLHIKRGDESQFLYDTTVTIEVDKLLEELITIFNGRLKITRICYELEELVKHGTFFPPEMLGLTDEQVEELHLVDDWGERCTPSGGWTYNKDPIGRRNGRQPSEAMQKVINKTMEEAKALVSKKLVQSDVCLTLKIVMSALDMLRGAVTIVYPMGLPPHDPIRQEFENNEDLTGTQASLDVLEFPKTTLWFSGKEMTRGKKLEDFIGKNEKSKIIVKLQKVGQGAPQREPVMTEEERKAMMIHAYRRQEELKEYGDVQIVNRNFTLHKAIQTNCSNKVSGIKPPSNRLAAVREEYDDIDPYPQPQPIRLNPQEVMRSSSSELLLDQQQELRRKKLLELVAPKKKKAPKRTCRQRVWFYTTSIVALTAVSAGSSLLFLVPLYVDPAISTLVADFTENPVTCITTRREDHSGIFNCTWSSCREGCTSDMYKCTHIYVSYYNALISTPSYDEIENSPSNGNNEGVLLVNIKGCGYPPAVNCGQFTATYGIEGAEFPCHYSRENRTLVMTHYDRDDEIQIIINYFAVPFIITVVSSVVLCIMHYDCQCSGQSTRRRRPRIENASDNSISQRVDMLIPHQEGLRPL